MDKAIYKGTRKDVSHPKQKHVDSLIDMSWHGMSTGSFFMLLMDRIASNNWVVAMKGLIILHILMYEGNGPPLYNYISEHSAILDLSRFRDTNGTIGFEQGRNVKLYALYLRDKSFAYKAINFDFVLPKKPAKSQIYSKVISDPKQLLLELSIVQKHINSLLKNQFDRDTLNNDCTIAMYRYTLRDCLRLVQTMNEGCVKLLQVFFELENEEDMQRALNLYKRYIKLTERIEDYLRVAKNFESVLNFTIPKFIQAPITLAQTLEDHIQQTEAERKQVSKDMHQLRKSIYVPSSQLPNKSWNQNQSQKQKQNIKPSTDDISDATRMRLNKPVLKLKSEFLPKSEESLSSTPNPPPQPTTVAKSQVEPASQPVLGDSYADKLKAEIMQIQNQIQQLQLQHQQQTIDSNNEFELAMQALQKPAAHFGPSADTFASPSPPPTFSVNNAVTSSMFNPQPSVNTNNITPAAVSDFFSPSPPLPTTFSSIPTSIPTSKPSITTNTTNDLSFFDPFAIKSVPSSKPSLSATAPLISNNPTFATDLFPPPPPPPPPSSSSSSTNPFHLHPTPIAKSSTTSNFGFASYTAASTPAPLPLQHSLTSSSTISSSNPFASSLYSQPQAPSQPQSQTQNTFTFSSATTTTHPSFSSINSAHHSTNPFLFPSSSNNNINSSANPVPNPVGISNFKNANSANTSNFADFTVFNRK